MQPHKIIIKSPVSAGMLEVFRLLDATGPAFMPLSLCSKAPEVLPAPWQLRHLNSQLTSQLRPWMETQKIALFKNHLRAPHFDCQFVLLWVKINNPADWSNTDCLEAETLRTEDSGLGLCQWSWFKMIQVDSTWCTNDFKTSPKNVFLRNVLQPGTSQV